MDLYIPGNALPQTGSSPPRIICLSRLTLATWMPMATTLVNFPLLPSMVSSQLRLLFLLLFSSLQELILVLRFFDCSFDLWEEQKYSIK
ncbi:hypothetical protein MANES_15G185366v8 [Manihot esculenta]|uniref:Uncharacterized protein n=1 Tax=Manihot esculenta TaxID=3983 RepID=A0ACB7GD85_MANES|nr:hypothetical protein MANES_15G185366v8 [Manihot esculenta]